MNPPRYVLGDATDPYGDGKIIIAHVCNDVRAWGAGFVLALSRRWPQPERAYRKLAMQRGALKLGTVQMVPVTDRITVANMIAQHGIYAQEGVPPIRYDALEACLDIVASHAKAATASVHMPRIGCGLAGGTWDQVGPLVERSLCDHDVVVWVYDLPVTG